MWANSVCQALSSCLHSSFCSQSSLGDLSLLPQFFDLVLIVGTAHARRCPAGELCPQPRFCIFLFQDIFLVAQAGFKLALWLRQAGRQALDMESFCSLHIWDSKLLHEASSTFISLALLTCPCWLCYILPSVWSMPSSPVVSIHLPIPQPSLAYSSLHSAQLIKKWAGHSFSMWSIKWLKKHFTSEYCFYVQKNKIKAS